jgi:hypothetical protein
MWIESSHRLDTGAPDDSLVATPASECRDDPVADRNAINRGFAIEGIAQDTAQTDDDAANVAPACPTD